MALYKANELAKYIVNVCNTEDRPISNILLQKYLYYIQGYFYKYFNTSAFDEPVYRWPYGPVIPDVYYEYSIYGSDNIYERYDDSIFTKIKGNAEYKPAVFFYCKDIFKVLI